MIIKTKKFTLRPIKLTDAQSYLECHKDKDAKRNFSHVPKNLNEAKKELKRNINKMKKKQGYTFAIEINKKFAGFVNLEINNKPMYKHSAILGIGIHKNYRKKGLGTAVIKKVTEFGFKKLKLKRIYGVCRIYNKASARMIKKAGFKLEGILRKNKYKDGKYIDDMVWAKTK